MMNGAAQTRRFQAVPTINGVPCNKMIVRPVRSNVCLSRFDLQRGSFSATRRESTASRHCVRACRSWAGRRQHCENLRTLDTRNTLRRTTNRTTLTRTYEAKRQAGAGSYCEHSDEAVWEKGVASFMVFLCFSFIEQLWRGRT
jgi:hypothetical protein